MRKALEHELDKPPDMTKEAARADDIQLLTPADLYTGAL